MGRHLGAGRQGRALDIGDDAVGQQLVLGHALALVQHGLPRLAEPERGAGLAGLGIPIEHVATQYNGGLLSAQRRPLASPLCSAMAIIGRLATAFRATTRKDAAFLRRGVPSCRPSPGRRPYAAGRCGPASETADECVPAARVSRRWAARISGMDTRSWAASGSQARTVSRSRTRPPDRSSARSRPWSRGGRSRRRGRKRCLSGLARASAGRAGRHPARAGRH